MNQEDSEQNEVDGMKTGADCTEGAAYLKDRFLIYNEKIQMV